MTDQQTVELLKRIAKTLTWDDQDRLYISPTETGVEYYLLCNDLFAWASADCEQITSDNIDLLEETFRELKDLNILDDAVDLFCCRSRKQRPQERYYAHIAEMLHPLFDACGTKENQYPFYINKGLSHD